MLNSNQHPLTAASLVVDHKVPAAQAFAENLQAAVEQLQAKDGWASAQQRQSQYANQRRREVSHQFGDS